MSKLLRQFLVVLMSLMTSLTFAQQVSNSDFEDWSGTAFDGNPQAKGWNASNVEQVGMKFNFAHKESGRNGGSCMMVQDQSVGAMGITETSPGYFSLGVPWAYLPSITAINQATAGTEGGISWTHRPDTMSVWIKRTGSNWDKEDFYLLYYSWSGTAKGDKYKGKNGSCTSTSRTNEESDIRQAVNHNECGTTTKATQVAEGMWRERKEYGNWTNIKVPILYMNNTAPTMMNLIFSASNYPNYRANDGLYEGNSLYVDDIEMIYSAAIQKLFVDGVEWKGFDPKSSEVQNYPLGESATSIPSIEAVRGAGSITNAKGETANFPGRTLSGSEITITNGDLTSKPTTITVKSGDGKKTMTYKIQFQQAASSNTKLAGIHYVYKDKNGNDVIGNVEDFSATKTSYNVDLPYGTKAAPVLVDSLIDKQEDKQKITLTQASSVTGTASIVVTAPNGKTTATYTLKFNVGKLADNTLKGITVNGKEIPGFTPSQLVYKVSLPVGTTKVPDIKAISEYPAGEQTIEYTLPTADNLNGGQAQIKVTTPGNQTPKIYKLNFKLEASSYSYLKDLKCGDYITNFEPEKLTYYVNLPLGTTTLPEITAVKGDEYQKEPEIALLEEGVEGTVRITTTAANGDQTVYKIVFSVEKSDISILYDLRLDGKTIDGFSSDVTTYDYALEIGTTELPEITWEKDEYAEVTIKEGGVNGATRITVTAGNGNTTIYVINFSVDAYTDNTLKSLSVEGYTLCNKAGEAMPYDAAITEYWVKLDKEATSLPEVKFEKQDENLQTVNTRDGGLNGDYRITVRPQGGASQTYIIHFFVEKSTNNLLAMIKIDNQPLEGFNPEDTVYTYNLAEGVSTIPSVSYVKGDEKQRVLNVQEDTVQILTVTAESGDKRVYRVNFHIQLSTNAYLEMIYLNGKKIANPFDSAQMKYEFMLAEGEEIPTVTVDKAPGQQVTIISPIGIGDVKILVAPGAGSANIYTITFTRKPQESVTLEMIYVNGTKLDGFQPTNTSYTYSYEGQLPTITYDKKDGQTVNVIWNDQTAWVHVSDTLGDKIAYQIACAREYKGVSTLKEIRANDVKLEDFDPNKRSYSYELVAGSEYPTLTCVPQDSTQRVFFGQIAEGTWQFIVTADNEQDTAQYTVKYSILPYEGAKLQNITLTGETLNFEEDVNEYSGFMLDEGAPLPDMNITRRPGQTVLVANLNDTTQQILVMAENGQDGSYTIHYQRSKSANAELAGILLDGQLIDDFAADKLSYVDSLNIGATAIPVIFPIRGNDNQTIVTEFCYPNGTATITVTSQDNSAQKVYTIAFPVRKSNNTALEEIALYDAEGNQLDFDFKPGKLDYEYTLEYTDQKCPRIDWTRGEKSQRVDLTSRPIGQTSEIKVVAENGETRTYTILFKRKLLKEKNLLSMIRIVELDKELSLKNKDQRDFDVEMPFGSRTLTIEYEKKYPEQTVFIEPGGVKNPTVITVIANNDTVENEVYRIIPTVPTEDPATLTDIKVNGNTITGFNPEKFSYIVPITEKPILRYTVKKGAEINITYQSTKHWQAEVTYSEGANVRTNTYDVWYYYTEEQVPNADFTEDFVSCKKATSRKKPKGWNTIGDGVEDITLGLTVSLDDLVAKSGSSVNLRTVYSTTRGGMIPGFITLGNVTGSWGVAGSSSFSVSGGIPFHNSPDVMRINYALKELSSHNQIQYILTGSEGEKTLEWHNSSTNDNAKTFTYDLTEANVASGDPTLLNIVINSYKQISGTIAANGARMTVNWIDFIYNHTLSALKVDAFDLTPSGNVFTAELTDPERIEKPVLLFTGEVADQAQDVNWQAPTKGTDEDAGFELRKATIRNWAENGVDYTDYSLTVKRPIDTNANLSDIKINGTSITGFAADELEYTVNIGIKERIPDVYPLPASSLQTITTVYDEANTKMTISVKAESGAEQTYTVTFVRGASNNTKLQSLFLENVSVDKDVLNHEVTAGYMPKITFVKESDLQIVVVNGGVISVTAEDGTIGEYIITCHDTVPAQGSAKLKEFNIDGTDIPDTQFGEDNTEFTHARPESVKFIQDCDGDKIVFTQNARKMEWNVKGANNNEKTYTLTYPTAKSDNAQLKELLINGEPWSDFNANTSSVQKILADSAIVIEAVPANIGQGLTISQNALTNNNVPARGEGLRKAASINSAEVNYVINVTSEDETASQQYNIQVLRPVSNNDSLTDILVNGQSIPGFRMDSLNYIITLPSSAIKEVESEWPSITYVAGHHAQTIVAKALLSNDGLSEETTIEVISEAGGQPREYKVTVQREPSHCSSLTGIMVNGEALDKFEPGRHYYSLELKTRDITIVPTSNDRFQTYETRIEGRNHIIKVIAQDGVTVEEYTVDIFIRDQSNDAHLSNIFLEVGDSLVSFNDFDRTLNPTLKFKEDKLDYIINLPSGTTVPPSIVAQLKLEGQTVSIGKKGMADSIVVTAPDGLSKCVYYLDFQTPKSKNANLSMIFLDGDSIDKFIGEPFKPDYYFYTIVLDEGVHNLPEVAGQKGESHQRLGEVSWDLSKNQASIPVQAEDPDHSNSYVLVFQYTLSDADTLQMIYADDEPITAFKPSTFFYNDSLPVGSAFPVLSWAECDEWQEISIDTALLVENNTLIRQIQVVAESGKSNVYTLTYNVRQSDVDTLQMIYLDKRELPGFVGSTNEYSCELSASYAAELGGRLPTVEYIKGDAAQGVTIVQAPDSLDSKSLGYKSLITVTAASGRTRTYTIHYPVQKSAEATLTMIMLSGKPIVGFDSERLSYRLVVDYGADLPLVSVVKKEDVQVCDIRFSGDSIYVDVTAENGFMQTYSLFFERRLSANAKLADLVVTGHDDLRFRPDEYDYLVRLPYGEDTIPAISWKLQDSLQTVPDSIQMDTLETGQVVAQITVVAPNKEDEASYIITFQFEKNNDNKLLAIYIDTTLLAGFDGRLTEYEYNHPFGSDSTAFFGIENVHYELSDSLARDSIYTDGKGVIFISVTAQNGLENIYTITQTIGLDNDNALSAIIIAGDTIRGFDPEILGYTYFVPEGAMPPELQAFARSENADEPIWRDVQAGDTCFITVRAQDRSERKYYVHFAISTLNTALEATASDVLIKRIPGTFQIFVGTLRAGVTFALYDQFGNSFFPEPMKIDPADANDTEIITDADQQERLNDIYNTRSGVLIDLMPNQIYLFGFYGDSNKKNLKSGKIKIIP